MIFKIKTSNKYFNAGTASISVKQYFYFINNEFDSVEITNTSTKEVRTFNAETFKNLGAQVRYSLLATKIYVFDYNSLLVNYTPTTISNTLFNNFTLTQVELASRWNVKACRISELHRFGLLKPDGKEGRLLVYQYNDVTKCEANPYFKNWIVPTAALGV